MKWWALFAVLLGLAVGGATAYLTRDSGDAGVRPGAPMRAVVSIAPLKGLIEPLLPEGAEVVVLIPPGVSEHGYELRPGDAAALARADVVAIVGLGLEPRIEQILERRPREGRLTLVMGDMLGIVGDGHDHGHDHSAHAHDCGLCAHGTDPHLWLDPVLTRQFVERAAGAMASELRARGLAGEADGVLERGRALARRIDEMHESYASRLAPAAGSAIVTHHAAWGRLADRYGLVQAAVVRPIESAEPTPSEIADAVRAIEERGAKVLFIEPQFSDRGARRLAERTGIRVGQLDPLGGGDWFAMMGENLRELERLLVPEGQRVGASGGSR
ncbi:MAG: zinc ABC transporter substrate-binding protein [Phycisphaerales bacterium]|nr:MAG: zinc ABC transporter substrate-binding protein [Phycisphaerales bacterium]